MGKDTKIKKLVREEYAKIAVDESSCCVPKSPCGGGTDIAEGISKKIGYTDDELKTVPEGANLGLGCGNPTALASLKDGETVLDLGSGAGFDCFLAAEKVGSVGKVIGVDMTPEMIDKARENARKGSYNNVEFRLGEIEHLPAADSSVDVVISNCVINLSPDKQSVFNEAFRVLKPGGRLIVTDIVLLQDIPESIMTSVAAYVGCIAGSVLKVKYLEMIESAGFEEVTVIEEKLPVFETILNDPVIGNITGALSLSPEELREQAAKSVRSIAVKCVKPA